MKFNRVCPECETHSCKIEFNTLLDSVYCSKCLTRFEYSNSSRQLVRFVFSLASFISVVILFYSESLLFTVLFFLLVMIPALYLSIWQSSIKVSGLKGIRKRIRDRR